VGDAGGGEETANGGDSSLHRSAIL